MNEIFMLNENEKNEIFEEVARRMNTESIIVEKDFWVTWILGKIFADTNLSKIMMFKGGTSLSKVFNLIGSFSEDIDLAFDWRLIANQESFEQDFDSKTQQDKFNKQIDEIGRKYIKDELLDMFSRLLSPLCECMIGENKNCIIVKYPNIFKDDYINLILYLKLDHFHLGYR